MIDVGFAALVLIWGILLGAVYFGGLWLTVRRLTSIERRAVWVIGSFFIRNAIAVAGFYPVVKLGWVYALICLTGFIMVRWWAVRRISPSKS